MKTRFNRSGQETYASRQAELEAHAAKIDAFLKTPQRPGMHLTPDGALRRNATKHAHDVMRQKRIDIAKELQTIAQHRQKHQMQERAKVKSL